MKQYKSLLYALTAVAMLGSCAKEDPFVGPAAETTGMLSTRSLGLSLANQDGLEAATRAAVPSTDDFKVVIARKSVTTYADGQGSVEYKYSEMPEVLTLPVDDYKVYAYHGENKPAAWDEPYYYGESTFGIEANKITDDVEPIVAKLTNVRVTIVFHPSLQSAMSPDSKVEVKVGDQGKMEFSASETRSAYFRYVNKSQTLTATFSGRVDGAEVVESKVYDNVAPGNHYRITFRMHGIDDDEPGTISGGITVDASVEKVDMNRVVDGEQEEILEDDMRPLQGGGDEPDPGPGPGPDNPSKPKPHAEELPSSNPDYAGYDMIDLSKVNEITDHLSCAWKVVSEAEGGFKEFTVTIISDTLTPDVLEGVGLTDKLNLINPKQFAEALSGLGFPVNIGGLNEAEFDITGFLSLMKALGEANHEFKMTVTDANGTSVISLKLHNN